MPEFNPKEFIETQRTDWNRVAPAWEKWDAWLDAGLAPCNQHLVERARISSGDSVLDLGSGTGYPALHAAQRVGDTGRVIGLDLAHSMLSVARRKAAALGLPHVVTFQPADVTSISFEPSTFHAAISRFCLMFLPHLESTLREVYRVLKPGGHIAAAVWAAPEKNPYLTLPLSVMKSYFDLPAPDPRLPGIFRLGTPGELLQQMEKAGFTDVREEEFPVNGVFSSGREYVACLQEMAAPLQALFSKLPEDKKGEAEGRMAELGESFRQGSEVRIPGVALVVTGRK
jgi:ubiquinone/menaquinone biosynthesis C-methylase UbiE